MKRILITGISGFVGTNLTKYLESLKEFKVIGHSRNPESARLLLGKIDFIPNISAITLDRYMIDTVIHLAGIAHDLSGKYTKEDYLNVNYEFTKEVFDCVHNSKVSSFIYVSSVKAIADETNLIIDENFVPIPQSDYGLSKRMSEEYLINNRKQHKKIYILRPCMIHGPGNKGNLNTLYKFVKRGIPYPLAAFDNRRSFLSIDNFCFVIDYILNNRLASGSYLLADSEAISTRELVRLIGETQGKKVYQLKLPKILIKGFAKIGTRLGSSLNSKTLGKLVGNLQVSNQKLLSNMGTELPLTTAEGLKKTIRSFNE